ncbi:MAG: NfeD family protein [Acidobacteriota bacterium]
MPDGFWTVLLLLCIGYTLMLLELVVPGGVVGIAGVGVVAWGIWRAFVELGLGWGFASVVTSLVVFVVGFRVFFHSSARRGLILDDESARDWKAPREELRALLGRRGETVSALRPAGLARFGDAPGEDRVDVVSESEFLPLGVAVEVVEVEGNRIVVAAVAPEAVAAEAISSDGDAPAVEEASA